MKKYFSITLILALAVTVFSSCKKDQVKPDETEITYAADMRIMADGADPVNATLIGSKDQLNKAIDNPKGALVQRIATGGNVFSPVLDPIDSYAMCWAEVDAYYAAHIEEWQAIANRECREFLVCIGCPNAGGGLFVMYAIKPNCKEAVFVKDTFELYKK